MISRVAESCFWLGRYIERADNTARLLRTNHSFVLDVGSPIQSRWRPVLVVSGEHERFPKLFSDESCDDGEHVQEYMTWNQNNPASILSSKKWARENARTIREIISSEMWENLNGFWHFLNGRKGRDLYRSDRNRFYSRVSDASALFLGESSHTLSHDESFAFLQLGVFLERAGQTARLIDVKHHALGSSDSTKANPLSETALETAHAMALLRSCSASEPFVKQATRAPSGPTVISFLYGDTLFPRSIRYSFRAAKSFLDTIRIHSTSDMLPPSSSLVSELIQSIDTFSKSETATSSIHEELTRIVDDNAALCDAIHTDYFDPSFDTHTLLASQTKQDQS